jgi:hypothetical protein
MQKWFFGNLEMASQPTYTFIRLFFLFVIITCYFCFNYILIKFNWKIEKRLKKQKKRQSETKIFWVLHKFLRTNYHDIGESRGLVVKAEDSQLSGCGFEPRRRILDGGSKASYYKLQWKKRNKNSQMGHTKKI